MKSYGQIIEEQREKLNQNINWWPLYLYHFTDVIDNFPPEREKP